MSSHGLLQLKEVIKKVMMYLTMNTDTTGNFIIPDYCCVACIDYDILQLLVLIQNSDTIVTDFKFFLVLPDLLATVIYLYIGY